MKRAAFAAGTVSVALSGVAAAGAKPSAPATPAADPGAAIDAYVTAALARTPAAGVTVAVGRDGTTVVARAFGQADRERSVAATAQTRYRIGSVTKQFTAACVLLLAQDGKLSLDDPLARHVPEFAHASEITLRQMLQQTSGLSRDIRQGFDTVFADTTAAQVIAKLNGYPLDFAPGTQFEYANLNYYLLGVVVERVAGSPFADVLAARITRPFNLADTFFDGSRGALPVAAGYVAGDGGLMPAKPWNVAYTGAAAALVSTAADLLTWNAALRSGHVVSPASYATMTAKPALPAPHATEYAMGLIVNELHGAVRIWHNGEVGGGHAMNAQYRDVGYDVVVLSNTTGARAFVPEHCANVVVGFVAPACAFAVKAEGPAAPVTPG